MGRGETGTSRGSSGRYAARPQDGTGSFLFVFGFLQPDPDWTPEALAAARGFIAEAVRNMNRPVAALFTGTACETSSLRREAGAAGVATHAELRAETPHAPLVVAEASDVVFLATGTVAPVSEARMADYALSENARLIRIAPDGTITPAAASAPPPPVDDWMPGLFARCPGGLSPRASIQEIHEKMSEIADRTPRVAWVRLCILQALGVFLPLIWFLTLPPAWLPDVAAATIALFGIGAMVVSIWWVQWKGAQKFWARARLVTEITRSLLETVRCGEPLCLNEMRRVPALQQILFHAIRDGTAEPAADWRESYIHERLEGGAGAQIPFYGRTVKREEAKRRKWSAWASRFTDASLALAILGLVFAFAPEGREILRVSLGHFGVIAAFALLGALFPLATLTVQAIQNVLDVHWRTARFRQQHDMLVQALAGLRTITSDDQARQMGREIEERLVAENIEWFVRTENATFFHNRFSRWRERKLAQLRNHPNPGLLARLLLGATRHLGTFGLATLEFAAGKLLVAGITLVIGVAFLTFARVSGPEAQNHFKDLGELKNSLETSWDPNPPRANVGCVIIVHGLRDQVSRNPYDLLHAQSHWPVTLAREIEDHIPQLPPNVAVLDWAGAADPEEDVKQGFGQGAETVRLISGVVSIRPQAEQIGEILALKIWQRKGNGPDSTIRTDRPLHFIGHSAGGFVVARAVRRLIEWGYPKDSIHVTILDTPASNSDIRKTLPQLIPGALDFYMTSQFVTGPSDLLKGFPGLLPEDIMPVENISGLNAINKARSPSKGPMADHSHACDWFIETIQGRHPGEGFESPPWRRLKIPPVPHTSN